MGSFTLPRMGEQLTFDWTGTAANPAPVEPPPAVPKTSARLADEPVIQPRASGAAWVPGSRGCRRYLRDAVERYLRERKIPYVSVDEAKKALFANAKLGAFHFVAYHKTGPNWLLWAAQVRKGVRADMAEWEKVFGDGFLAVVASEKKDGQLAFKTLKGETVEIS